MKSFTDQFAATRANLARLETLVMESPELFDYAYGNGADPDRVWAHIHASLAPAGFDWRSFALRHSAKWQRERSYDGTAFNWKATIGGVQITILGAEPTREQSAVFAEGAEGQDRKSYSDTQDRESYQTA